jgi:hypothetical protein
VNALTSICSVLFALSMPLITVAGLLTKLGVSGPHALVTSGTLMIGGWLLVRLRRRP